MVLLGFTLFTKLYYLALLSLRHHVTTTLQDHNDYAGLKLLMFHI